MMTFEQFKDACFALALEKGCENAGEHKPRQLFFIRFQVWENLFPLADIKFIRQSVFVIHFLHLPLPEFFR